LTAHFRDTYKCRVLNHHLLINIKKDSW